MVDCIKIDTQYKKICWAHARVAFVIDTHIKVTYVGDKEINTRYQNFFHSKPRYIEKQSNVHEIAPFKTRCHDFEWRNSLKPGDEIDACDTTSVWYNATVLDTRTIGEGDKAFKEVKIGNTPEIRINSLRLQNFQRKWR
jgi:hypothetical protein